MSERNKQYFIVLRRWKSFNILTKKNIGLVVYRILILDRENNAVFGEY